MSAGRIPRAVASGVNGPTTDEMMVRARRVGLVAGILAAVFVFAWFSDHDVPSRAVELVGGAGAGVARYGGVVATWTPAPGRDAVETRPSESASPTLVVRRDGNHWVVELPGVSESAAPDVIARLSAGGGLEFREVIESTAAKGLVDLGLATIVNDVPATGDDAVSPPSAMPRVEIDQWAGEDGRPHSDLYLVARNREDLERAIAEAERRGWSPPPGTQLAVQRLDPVGSESGRGALDHVPTWRSYFVSDQVALDGSAVENATGSFDPNTNRPIVLLEFNRAGGRRFGELTERLVGHKLATLLGGVVKSAPVINGPIRGGRASIAMGGSDGLAMERERDDLVATLHAGSLPLAGTITNARWVAGSSAGHVALARVLLALAAGGLALILSWFVVRIARPERRRVLELPQDLGKTRSTGLGKRLAWTLFASGVYIVGTYLTMPGLNDYELAHIMSKGGGDIDWTQFSVFALGVTPLLTSFVVVELAASIVGPWRRLRDTIHGRRRLGLAAAISAAVVSALQAYFVATYLRGLDRGGLDVFDPHMFWATVATLAAGPMLLAILASLITSRGLGNGYAVLIAVAFLWSIPWFEFPGESGAGLVRTAIAIAIIATITLVVLGWRVRGPGRAPIPLPASGAIPLHDGGGAVAVLATLAALGVTLPPVLADAAFTLHGSLVLGSIVLVAATALWAFVFARPGRRRTELAAAGFEPTDPAQWGRAVLVTAAALTALFALALARAPGRLGRLADPAIVVVVVATLADVVAEWRARRCAALIAVWPLHDPLLLDPARELLAGLPHHIQATRLRTLLSMFGSYVPMIVWVPEAHATEAHARLRAWLDPDGAGARPTAEPAQPTVI